MPTLRILVTGATGFLGPYAVAALRARGMDVVATGRSGGDVAIDLGAPGMVAAVLEATAPDLVLHLAAMAKVGDCEADPARARRVNAAVPGEFAARLRDRFVFVSTDLVFDGRSAPYDENAAAGPLSVYGASKVEGEERVRQAGGRVVRAPLLFGPDARGRGATASLRQALAAGAPVTLSTNEYRSPLHAADAARGLAELAPLRRGPQLVHLAGPERCSRWELGRRFAAAAGLDVSLLRPAECQDPLRPRDVSLAGCWTAERGLDAMLADG